MEKVDWFYDRLKEKPKDDLTVDDKIALDHYARNEDRNRGFSEQEVKTWRNAGNSLWTTDEGSDD